jgi:hypothetical protein
MQAGEMLERGWVVDRRIDDLIRVFGSCLDDAVVASNIPAQILQWGPVMQSQRGPRVEHFPGLMGAIQQGTGGRKEPTNRYNRGLVAGAGNRGNVAEDP